MSALPSPRVGLSGLAFVLALAFALAVTSRSAAEAAPTSAVQIPHERYQLPSGFTVILHEDHRQPLAMVHLGFAVGSANDPTGRTGLAHLFEHLMFMGTAKVPTGELDRRMEREGAWNNAETSEDRTVYYDVGPSHSLPLLLWLEADRIGALGGQLTAAKLEAQRSIVHNERRESENGPYGKADLRLPELLFPAGHPYHHPVVGSHEDLDRVSVDDARGFFSRWYAPRNGSIVVAGDFDRAIVRGLLERWLGPLGRQATRPDRPPPPAPPAPPAPPELHTVVRETLRDEVALAKLIMAWPSPPWFAPGDAELDLVASIATSGKESRLYRAMLYDQPLAQSVTAAQHSMQLASFFSIEVVARSGVTLQRIENAIEHELVRLRSEPVSEAELVRAKNQYETLFVSRLQSLPSRARLLSMYQGLRGDPGAAQRDLDRYRAATPGAIQSAVATVLRADARVVLHVLPMSVEATAVEVRR